MARKTRSVMVLPLLVAASLLASCSDGYDPPDEADPADTIAPPPAATPVPEMEDPET